MDQISSQGPPLINPHLVVMVHLEAQQWNLVTIALDGLTRQLQGIASTIGGQVIARASQLNPEPFDPSIAAKERIDG